MNEPAFPIHPHYQGLTLRDWFAGQALCGILTCPEDHGKALNKDYQVRDALRAEQAYDYAELMLAEKAKREAKGAKS